MPETPNQPNSRLELEQDSIYGKYLLHSRTEIIFVLRSVMQKGSLITVYFDSGRAFLLTTLIDIDAEQGTLLFDMGSDQEMNARALKADRLVFTTQLDKVKIQFSLRQLETAQHGGRPAMRGAVPGNLLRLQRREYYRLSTPAATPVQCRLMIPPTDGSSPVSADIPLLDISGGGVGLFVKYELKESFKVDMVFRDCRIDLPDEGLLVCNLVVRNVFEVTTKNGSQHLRVGCEFDNLPGTRLTMVQRYITRIERERKARASGLE